MAVKLKATIPAFLSLVIFVQCQNVYMPPVVYSQRRAGDLSPSSGHFGNLYLPVDGRNATLDCWNYDRNPKACAMIPHCRYHCHSGHCKDSSVPDEKSCSQYCLDVCGCKQAGCFDEAGVNCRPNSGCPFDVPEPNPKGPPMTLRKSNRFPFNLCPDGLTVQRISPKRGDFEYVPVLAINLGGERHVDSNGWIFNADANFEPDDPDGIKGQGEIPPEEIFGVAEEDIPLYATYIKGGGSGGGGGGGSGGSGGGSKGNEKGQQKGEASTTEESARRKRGEGSETKGKEKGGEKEAEGEGEPKCVHYVASLCEEGNYLLDLKVVEPEYEETGSRLFDVRINDVVVLDELNILAWTKKKGRVAEILVRFFFGAGEAIVVGGQRANVTDGEVKISFCEGDCPNATDRGFVASAFQILHWQRSVNVYGQPVSHRGDECRCRILAGKEYNYETTQCSTARECTPCSTKSTCMRANAVYVSGGMSCKNRFARGSCIIEEVVNAVNINGRAHHDSRGIRYVADDDSLFDDPFKLRYDIDGDILSYGACPVDPWTKHVVTGVVAADAILYETFTRSLSSGTKGMCMYYNISESVKTEGKYELVVKTVEPFYERQGQRSFSIRLFHDEAEQDKPVLADFDILKFSEPCEATDVVINFEVTGDKVVIPGHEPRDITDERMKLGFCLSSCSANITKNAFMYDPDFIVSAFYIARVADKPEPHIEGMKNKTAGGEGGEGGGGETGGEVGEAGEGGNQFETAEGRSGGDGKKGGKGKGAPKPGGTTAKPSKGPATTKKAA